MLSRFNLSLAEGLLKYRLQHLDPFDYVSFACFEVAVDERKRGSVYLESQSDTAFVLGITACADCYFAHVELFNPIQQLGL